MITETMEKIMVIPLHWRVGKVRDTHVSVDIEGHTQVDIPLSQFADGALRQLRAILLGKIHSLVMERACVYKDIAAVNGELDRRVNEASCRNNPPPAPSLDKEGERIVRTGIIGNGCHP